MDLLFFFLEALVSAIDLLAVGADIYSWIRGKDNRVERRHARSLGVDVPPRDKWNRRVLPLTLLVIALTSMLLLWKSR